MAKLKDKDVIKYLINFKVKLNKFYDNEILKNHPTVGWKSSLFCRKMTDVQQYEKIIIDDAIIVIKSFKNQGKLK